MSFLDQIKEDFTNIADADEFTESVSYVKADGTTRTVKAWVDRLPPARIDSAGNVYTPRITLTVPCDSTIGILPSEVDAHGSDRISVAIRVGETATSLGVYLAPGTSHDQATMTLDLR